MTHELLRIIENYKIARDNLQKTVLATVVATKGSTYRRPGVRMLINENGSLTGAVSGGCVEKEVVRQAQNVFTTKKSTILIYDGRYKLGCEGILYILIEPFEPSGQLLQLFDKIIASRTVFKAEVIYSLSENKGHTQFVFNEHKKMPVNLHVPEIKLENPEIFSQNFTPVMRLLIIGAEHDAVQLCAMASLMGWEVWVVAPVNDPRNLLNFPGASQLLHAEPNSFETAIIDTQTAVLLMTHSFVRDLQYLNTLQATKPCYLGLLGPAKRREKLLNSFLEQFPDANTDFFESIHGPAGLHLGAETPQEIAVAILAEILSVTRNTKPFPLKNKKGTIHSNVKW